MKLAPVLAIGAGLLLTACSGTKITPASSPSASSSSSATASAPAAPSSSASASTTGPVGTTYIDSDSSGNSYDVTLVKVLDPARPDNSFDAAGSGSRLVGAEFTIKGVSGSTTDDANNDAAVQGSDDQTYQPAFNGLSAGTNFSSGQFTVSSGQTETGWVAFTVPDGVRVASVQWQPDAGLSSSVATWKVAP